MPRCMECLDGAVECGDSPCKGGAGLPPWIDRGKWWLPICCGIEVAVDVKARVRFKKTKTGKIVTVKGVPVHTIDVRLVPCFRTRCIETKECKE